MEFKIVKNSERWVTVSVKIPKRSLAVDPNIHVDTQDVVDFLAREGISIASCSKEVVLDNYSDNPKLEGEWVFDKTTAIQRRRKPFTDELKKIKSRVRNERNTNVGTATSVAKTTRRRRKIKKEPEHSTEP